MTRRTYPLAVTAGATEEDRGTRNWRSMLFVFLFFLPFLLLAVIYLKTSFQSIFVRNEIDYPEGASVYAFLTALRTGKLYSSPFELPLNVQMYGPFYYLIGTGLAKLANGDPMLTTRLCRALSFLSFLGSVGLIGFLSWRLERDKSWATVSIILGLACSWAVPYASARPDSLSIFFILAALTLYQVAQGRNRLIFWVGVLGTLSCLTKQSMAPVLIALLIDTLVARRFRNTAALIGGCVPLPALFLITLWLRHEPFLVNFLAAGHTIFDWRDGLHEALILILRYNRSSLIPISIAVLGVGLSWRKEKYRPILLAVAFGCISNLAALANIGGSQNYLILPWLLMILLVPAGLVKVQAWSRRSLLIPVGLSLLGILVLVYKLHKPIAHLPADLDTSGVGKINMLTDLPYLEEFTRQPQLLESFDYQLLFSLNLFSFAPINRQIDDEEYDLVLINGVDGPANSEFSVAGFRGISLWSARTLSEIGLHYRELCEVPGYLAFVPRDKSSTLQSEDIGRIFRQPCNASNRTLQLAPGMR